MNEPDPNGPCLYAFDIPRDGPARPLSGDPLTDTPSDDVAFRWIHLNAGHPSAMRLAASLADETVAAALTQEDTRPRLARHKDGRLLNLRGMNLNPGCEPEDMISLRMWMTDGLLLSVRLRRLQAVVALREDLCAGKGPRSVDDFIATLAEGLIERMDGVVASLVDQVDDLEEMLLAETPGLQGLVAELRRDVIILRRYLAPQREALTALATDRSRVNGEAESVYEGLAFREVMDDLTRYVEDLDSLRERTQVLTDQLADKRAREMNRHSMVLSVVAAIFLPLGFLTGLLGINVGGIPLADSPFGFVIVCALTLGIGFGLALFFRRLRWL